MRFAMGLAMGFAMVALLLSGCHSDISYSISVNSYASPSTVYTNNEVGFTAVITATNTSISIASESWSVVTAPGGYTLTDSGSSAAAIFSSGGDYVVQYYVSYWTDYGTLESQVSWVTVHVIAPAPG